MSCLQAMLIKSQLCIRMSGWHCWYVFLVRNVQLVVCDAQENKQHLGVHSVSTVSHVGCSQNVACSSGNSFQVSKLRKDSWLLASAA